MMQILDYVVLENHSNTPNPSYIGEIICMPRREKLMEYMIVGWHLNMINSDGTVMVDQILFKEKKNEVIATYLNVIANSGKVA